MAKRNKSRIMRLPPRAAPLVHKRPKTEIVEIHTGRAKSGKNRNASGRLLDGKASTIVPVLGGIAGGTAAVIASQKWDAHPGLIAAGTAAAGLAAMTMAKQPWLRQAGAGAVVGAAVVGAVPLVVGALQKQQQHQQQQLQLPPAKKDPHRSADGDGYVTRQELNDALGKLADSHKETQKQQTCDLVTALRGEIKQVLAEGPNGPGLPAASDSRALGSSTAPALSAKPPAHLFSVPFASPRVMNDARIGDDYARNAYGDDLRDAEADDYTRNAYGEDLRDALAYDERDASPYEERDAAGYDERDASGEERDALGDERDADADQLGQMTGGSSM